MFEIVFWLQFTVLECSAKQNIQNVIVGYYQYVRTIPVFTIRFYLMPNYLTKGSNSTNKVHMLLLLTHCQHLQKVFRIR